MATKKKGPDPLEKQLDEILSAWINRPSPERKLSIMEQVHLLVIEMNDADNFRVKTYYKYPQHEPLSERLSAGELSKNEGVLFSIHETLKTINKKLDPKPPKPSLAQRILSKFKRKPKFDDYD